MEPSATNESVEYEQLTASLAKAFADRFDAATTRCQQNVVIPGKGTSNQIDVLWEGLLEGEPHRVVIECKHYKRKIDQSKLHAFRSVLSDIESGTPTTGVFVTTEGYQSGAKSLAHTYGISVLELRAPKPTDLAGRVTQITFNIIAKMPVLDVNVEVANPSQRATGLTPKGDLHLLFEDGSSIPLVEYLFADHIDFGQRPLTQLGYAKRTPPPGTMLTDGTDVYGPLKTVGANGREESATTTAQIGPGVEGIAQILKDSATGRSFWIETDGKIRELSA